MKISHTQTVGLILTVNDKICVVISLQEKQGAFSPQVTFVLSVRCRLELILELSFEISKNQTTKPTYRRPIDEML